MGMLPDVAPARGQHGDISTNWMAGHHVRTTFQPLRARADPKLWRVSRGLPKDERPIPPSRLLARPVDSPVDSCATLVLIAPAGAKRSLRRAHGFVTRSRGVVYRGLPVTVTVSLQSCRTLRTPVAPPAVMYMAPTSVHSEQGSSFATRPCDRCGFDVTVEIITSGKTSEFCVSTAVGRSTTREGSDIAAYDANSRAGWVKASGLALRYPTKTTPAPPNANDAAVRSFFVLFVMGSLLSGRRFAVSKRLE